MSEPKSCYRSLESETCDRHECYREGWGTYTVGTPNRAEFMRALQERGRIGRKFLAPFEAWLVRDAGLARSTAKRKRKIIWAAICDYPEMITNKYHLGHETDRCWGISTQG